MRGAILAVALLALPATVAAQIVDPAGCAITIDAPADHATVGDRFTAQGSVWGLNGYRVRGVTVALDGGGSVPAAVSGTKWTAAIDATGLSGPRHLEAYGDPTGGFWCWDWIELTVRPVDVVVASPASGADVAGIQVVEGTASSVVPVTKVEVRLAGGAWVEAARNATATEVAWSASLDTRGIANGPSTIEVRGLDADGATGHVTVPVRIANPSTVDLQPTTAFCHGSLTRPSRCDGLLAVRNLGNTASGPVAVRLEFHHTGAWHVLDTVTVGVPGFSTTGVWLAYESGYRYVGRFPLRAIVDPGNGVAETSETNNVLDGSAWWAVQATPGVALPRP